MKKALFFLAMTALFTQLQAQETQQKKIPEPKPITKYLTKPGAPVPEEVTAYFDSVDVALEALIEARMGMEDYKNNREYGAIKHFEEAINGFSRDVPSFGLMEQTYLYLYNCYDFLDNGKQKKEELIRIAEMKGARNIVAYYLIDRAFSLAVKDKNIQSSIGFFHYASKWLKPENLDQETDQRVIQDINYNAEKVQMNNGDYSALMSMITMFNKEYWVYRKKAFSPETK